MPYMKPHNVLVIARKKGARGVENIEVKKGVATSIDQFKRDLRQEGYSPIMQVSKKFIEKIGDCHDRKEVIEIVNNNCYYPSMIEPLTDFVLNNYLEMLDYLI